MTRGGRSSAQSTTSPGTFGHLAAEEAVETHTDVATDRARTLASILSRVVGLLNH